MSLAELLQRIVEILDEERIMYMLTGSLAAAYYGTPKATRDIDIVFATDRAGMDRLVGRLTAAGLYVDRDAALEAMRSQAQFNAIAPVELLERAGSRPDLSYVDRWVRELGLTAEWGEVLQRVSQQ